MARDTIMYAAVPSGSQYVEGVGVSMGPPNYANILNGRQEWWWEPGPVDSCCFCCHLEGGIMVLAGLKTAANAILLLLLRLVHHGAGQALTNAMQNATENALETAQEQYMTGCESNPPTLSYEDCQHLEQRIEELQSSLNEQQIMSLYGYFKVFCVAVGLVGGVAGLWACCGRNTFAAKLFFFSFPVSLALSIVSWIVKFIIIHQLTQHRPSRFYLLGAFTLILSSIYFMKVSWSYYIVLKTRDTIASSSNESDIELRGIGG